MSFAMQKIAAFAISASMLLSQTLATAIYEGYFGHRYYTYEIAERTLDEFEGLQLKECTFKSNNGQKLAGYKYSKKGKPKGLVVISHGFGAGGQNYYMAVADYFTSCGYAVFAYDATGNDKSEGEEVGGLPQGVIDLDYALRYVKSCKEYKGLPVFLFGHSWGAYSAGSVLKYHPDVKAVAMAAGFDNSADIIRYEGSKIEADGIDDIVKYMIEIDKKKFGEYADASCTAGFESSEAKVMLIHSRDDGTVPYNDTFVVFRKKYKDDPRFQFVSYKNRGHAFLFYDNSSAAYMNSLIGDLGEYAKSFDGFSLIQASEYLKKNLDKKKLFSLDIKLMDKIADLYESCIE